MAAALDVDPLAPERVFLPKELAVIGEWLRTGNVDCAVAAQKALDKRFSCWAGYMMPALSASLLTGMNDYGAGVVLVSEMRRLSRERQRVSPADLCSPLTLLRDPYSAKPYVLVYVSRKAIREAAQ